MLDLMSELVKEEPAIETRRSELSLVRANPFRKLSPRKSFEVLVKNNPSTPQMLWKKLLRQYTEHCDSTWPRPRITLEQYLQCIQYYDLLLAMLEDLYDKEWKRVWKMMMSAYDFLLEIYAVFGDPNWPKPKQSPCPRRKWLVKLRSGGYKVVYVNPWIKV
jgi:hypothetical protein